MSAIKLGWKVKDYITGFTGIAISQTKYLHGCTQIGVRSEELHEGKPIDVQWFDEPRLEVVEKTPVFRSEGSDPTPGGPRPTPPSKSHPKAG